MKCVDRLSVEQIYCNSKVYANGGGGIRSFRLDTGNVDQSVLNKIKRMLSGIDILED